MSIQTETPESGHSSRVALRSNRWLRLLTALAPVWTLLALGIFFSLASDSFLRPINLRNILAQISTLGIFTTGMTFVMLCGEIDLSIAEIAGLSGTIATTLYATVKLPEPWPVIAAIGVAGLLGFVNGVISTRFRIPTLMTTLAMGLMAAGLNNYISKGRVNNNVSTLASFLGSGKINVPFFNQVPVLIIVAGIALLIGYFILRYTRFGRYIYMTGASKP
ncbi:MAG: ABC transporter permease, partial [Chloroflexota bacterium]